MPVLPSSSSWRVLHRPVVYQALWPGFATKCPLRCLRHSRICGRNPCVTYVTLKVGHIVALPRLAVDLCPWPAQSFQASPARAELSLRFLEAGEGLEVLSELPVGFVVIAPDDGFLERAVHSFARALGPRSILGSKAAVPATSALSPLHPGMCCKTLRCAARAQLSNPTEQHFESILCACARS